MKSLKDHLGDHFTRYVEEGKQSTVFDIPCRTMNREELLACLSLAADQIGKEQRRQSMNDSVRSVVRGARVNVVR